MKKATYLYIFGIYYTKTVLFFFFHVTDWDLGVGINRDQITTLLDLRIYIEPLEGLLGEWKGDQVVRRLDAMRFDASY